MQPPPQLACMIIADISGYTGYLAGVELDHAQDILADLMGTVVKALRPFKLAKLEGDAAFVFAPTEKVDGSLLQDTVEGTYFAFRRRLRDIRQSTTCQCNACTALPQLDLKFVVHHGPVASQRMAGREELVGRDVILVHRLLKNAAEAKVGGHPYALYTDACAKAMGMDLAAQGLVPHAEFVDIIGEIRVWLRDLEAAWQAYENRQRIEVTPEDAHAVYRFDIAAPRSLVWEYMTTPGHRPLWSQGTDEVREIASNGRRSSGTINHCMHGKDTIIEEVLDWRPNELLTTLSTIPMIPGSPKLLMTDAYFDLADGGTLLETRVGKPKPKDKAAFPAMAEMIGAVLVANAEKLTEVVAAEAARRRAAMVDEPPLPESADRFIRQPVVAGHHAHDGHRH